MNDAWVFIIGLPIALFCYYWKEILLALGISYFFFKYLFKLIGSK